jgi:hypothetical protein
MAVCVSHVFNYSRIVESYTYSSSNSITVRMYFVSLVVFWNITGHVIIFFLVVVVVVTKLGYWDIIGGTRSAFLTVNICQAKTLTMGRPGVQKVVKIRLLLGTKMGC